MPFIKHISFNDDSFFHRSLEELREFAFQYKKNIDLPFFISSFNPAYSDEEKLKVLITAGMDRIRVGIQSGSERTQKLYNRTVPNEKIIKCAEMIHKYRKKLKLTCYDLILDNPFESKIDLIKTIKLVAQLPAPFTLSLFSLTCYPGTEIYEQAKCAGFLTDNLSSIYNKHYHKIENTYLNFILVTYMVFKLPKFLLNFMLKFTGTDKKVPKKIFQTFHFIGYLRRAVDLLVKGDPHTFARHMKIGIFKV